MTEETRTIKVDVDPGLLFGTVFVPVGKTVAAPKSRADVLLKDKHCSPADGAKPHFTDLYPQPTDAQAAAYAAKVEDRANAPVSEFMDWPSYGQLNKGGLTTVDQLKLYIAENGTLWSKKLELTDEQVEEIEATLEKLDAPKGKAKAKPKVEPKVEAPPEGEPQAE